MWKFGGVALGVTPVVGDPNIVLEAAASEYAEILEFHMGGEVTTSTLMRTRVTRAAEGVGSATAVATQKITSENQPAATIACTLGDHATTKAAPDDAGALWGESWNAHGGVIRWLASPGEEITLLGVSTVIIENDVGTALSTYGFVWAEK